MYDTSLHPQIMRDRYTDLPDEIKELFDHATVELVLGNITNELGLTEEQKDLLRMEVELVLFLFTPRQELSERLQESLELDSNRTQELTTLIENDLFVLVDNILAIAENELEKSAEDDTLQSTKSSPIVIPPIPDEIPISTPLAVEPANNASNQVKPLRTFAMDVDISRAHGYGAFRSGEDDNEGDEPTHHSSQDDIIKK